MLPYRVSSCAEPRTWLKLDSVSLPELPAMVAFVVLAGAMNFFSYWFSDKLVLKMYNAQEVDEQGFFHDQQSGGTVVLSGRRMVMYP